MIKMSIADGALRSKDGGLGSSRSGKQMSARDPSQKGLRTGRWVHGKDQVSDRGPWGARHLLLGIHGC